MDSDTCHDHKWRRTLPSWKQEEERNEWFLQHQYHMEQCRICKEQRFTRPAEVRRRYRRAQEETEPPVILKKLKAVQWSTLDTLINIMNLNIFEVQERLIEWVEEGWIEIEEQLVDLDWQIERVRLSPLLVRRKKEQRIITQGTREQQTIQYLSTLLNQWRLEYQEAIQKHHEESELIAVIEHIRNLFEVQEHALKAGMCRSLTGTTMMAGGLPHQRMVAILRGILELLAHPRIEYERIFSARWLHDSKAFYRERTELEIFLDLKGGLRRIGLVRHTPIVLSSGPWRARYGEYAIDGRAAISFTSIPSDMLSHLEDIQVDADYLLIIENRTPFELLVQSSRRNRRALYLDGAGFPGHAERGLVALWLRANPRLSWFVWTDFDQGGVGIQQCWLDWAMQEHLPTPRPYRWTRLDLDLCQRIGRPLTEEKRAKLTRINHPLAKLLCEWGYTAEQEAILGIFEDW